MLPRFAIFLAATFVVSPSWADSTPSSKPTLAEARSAFVEGRELIQRERWSEAEAQFRLAARVKNTPGLRYYVAYCQEKAGLLVEAFASYEEAAKLLEKQPAADVSELIPEARDRVRNALPQLAVRGAPEGAVVTVDGEALATSLAGPVNPGTHEVRVAAKGYEPLVKELTFSEGGAEVLSAKSMRRVAQKSGRNSESAGEFAVAGQANGASASSDGAGSLMRPVVFWSSVGLSAIGVGVGVFGVIHGAAGTKTADRVRSELAETTQGTSACAMSNSIHPPSCLELLDAVDQEERGELLTIAGFAGAGVGALGAVLTHYFWQDAPVEPQVSVARGAASVSLLGRF